MPLPLPRGDMGLMVRYEGAAEGAGLARPPPLEGSSKAERLSEGFGHLSRGWFGPGPR
jgi:hypothetical protein